MRNDALFVSETIFRDIAPFAGTLDYRYVLPHLQVAQDKMIQQSLGQPLFQKLKDDIVNDSLQPYYKALIDDFIVKALTWSAVYESLEFLSVKINNSGIVQKNNDEDVSIDIAAVGPLINKANDNAEFYNQRLINYLNANHDLFPEYNLYVEGELQSSTDNYSGGLSILDDEPILPTSSKAGGATTTDKLWLNDKDNETVSGTGVSQKDANIEFAELIKQLQESVGSAPSYFFDASVAGDPGIGALTLNDAYELANATLLKINQTTNRDTDIGFILASIKTGDTIRMTSFDKNVFYTVTDIPVQVGDVSLIEISVITASIGIFNDGDSIVLDWISNVESTRKTDAIEVFSPTTESLDGVSNKQQFVNEQFSSSLKALRDIVRELSGGATTLESDPEPQPVGTVETPFTFYEKYASTNEDVIEVDEVNNTVTIKKAGLYQFATFIYVLNTGTQNVKSLTLRTRDISDDSIVSERTLIVRKEGYSGTSTFTFNVLEAQLPLTIKFSTQADLVGLNIATLQTTLLTAASVGGGGGAAERENTTTVVSADAQTTTVDFSAVEVETLDISDLVTTHIIAVSGLSTTERYNTIVIDNTDNTVGLNVTFNDQTGSIKFRNAKNDFPGTYPTMNVAAGAIWEISFENRSSAVVTVSFDELEIN